MQLDDALEFLGAYGRYQIYVYLAISLFDNLPSIWHMSVGAFLAYENKHHCKIPYGATYNDTIPRTYDSDNAEWKIDKCNMYLPNNKTDDGNSTLVPCQEGWYFNPDPIQTTVVSEWSLVCSRNVLPEMSQMVFNFGVMFGALLFGFMSDKFGRKKSFIFALVAQSIIGSITSASPDFYVFMILRFIVGALEQGVNITGFIMATEWFPPKQRTILAVSHEYIWAIGGAILPFFAYFIRTWRYLQLCVSLPSILAIVLWWIIPESVVWLLAKGRIKEAEAILGKAAKFNRKTLPPNCLSDHETKSPMLPDDSNNANIKEEQVGDNRTYTVIDLFRTPRLRKITVCICGLWAFNTTVYYGLSYNTPNLYGNMYLNFFIGQMVEIPSVFATMFFIYRCGRRWPLCLFHVFCGLVCIASPFIPQAVNGWSLQWVSVTLAMLGKFAANASFTIIYMYGPEIYPTVVRNTGAGLASFSGRFGGIIYPYINYLSKVNSPLSKQLPLLVFGIVSVVGGFMALPLPETRHNPLPETIDDVENYEEFCKKHKMQHRAAFTSNGTELNVIGDGNQGSKV